MGSTGTATTIAAVYSGGRCQYDGDCCGYLICADGFCYDIYGGPYYG
jgi:hypothetical protein